MRDIRLFEKLTETELENMFTWYDHQEKVSVIPKLLEMTPTEQGKCLSTLFILGKCAFGHPK